MCEAEFPNAKTLNKHIDLLHGQYRFYSTWLGGAYSKCPYVISPTEKRGCVEHFAAVQQQAVCVAEDEPYVHLPCRESQRKQLWAFLYETCCHEAVADTMGIHAARLIEAKTWACVGNGKTDGPDLNGAVTARSHEPRGFEACVFCAMLHWSEQLKDVYIAGEQCLMKNPSAVADLVSVDCYSEQWPLIPRAELDASAVDFPYKVDDERTTKKS